MNSQGSITQRCLAALFSLFSFTQEAQVTPALVDFDAYEALVTEVKQHRQTHLLNAEEFVNASKEKNVIILDTRSDSMYAAVHVKGAIHLNFSDFTQANLAKIIPSTDCKVLIYCNNNFVSIPLPEPVSSQALPMKERNYERYFASKAYIPENDPFWEKQKSKQGSKKRKKTQASTPKSFGASASHVSENPKPLTLALNIPTYINLYGYGYRNVYELSELVNTYSDALEFEGTAVHP